MNDQQDGRVRFERQLLQGLKQATQETGATEAIEATKIKGKHSGKYLLKSMCPTPFKLVNEIYIRFERFCNGNNLMGEHVLHPKVQVYESGSTDSR